MCGIEKTILLVLVHRFWYFFFLHLTSMDPTIPWREEVPPLLVDPMGPYFIKEICAGVNGERQFDTF